MLALNEEAERLAGQPPRVCQLHSEPEKVAKKLPEVRMVIDTPSPLP